MTTEQKLQEELHIDQAVQDIVRLIKQDARTALLIVQLLRRYQLERNQQVHSSLRIPSMLDFSFDSKRQKPTQSQPMSSNHSRKNAVNKSCSSRSAAPLPAHKSAARKPLLRLSSMLPPLRQHMYAAATLR